MTTPITFADAWANPTVQTAIEAASRRFTCFTRDERRSIQMMTVWQALPRYRPNKASVASFLRGAVYKSLLRERRRDRKQRLETTKHRLFYENELTEDASERYAIGHRQPLPPLQRLSLKAALTSLSPADRNMFIDRILGRMTFADIATKYNCSKSAADRRLENIRRTLKKALAV